MRARAVVGCCLSVAGSIHSPYCVLLTQRETMMGKGKKKKLLKDQKPCVGKSILELYWDELDAIMDRLMDGDSEAADGRDPGRAETAAYFIALIINPYHPNIDAVKDECMQRWEDRQNADPLGETADLSQHGDYPQQSDEM